MQNDPHAIQIYTDGSCFKNPGGMSGCAANVYFPDHLDRPEEQIVDFGCDESNNNRMELLAVIRALRWVRDNRPWNNVTRVQLFTDSTYVKDYLNRALQWRSRGWRNSYERPVENVDLWKLLIAARSKTGMTVTIEQTKGKKTPRLKIIDKAAKAAAKRGGTEVDRGFRHSAVSRSKLEGSAVLFPAKGQIAAIHVYRKDLTHDRTENVVRFHLLSENLDSYVLKALAYATSELAFDLHRQHSYRVQFNDNPKYPQIIERLDEVQNPVQVTSEEGPEDDS